MIRWQVAAAVLLLLAWPAQAEQLRVDATGPSRLALRISGQGDYRDMPGTTPLTIVVSPGTRYDVRVVRRLSFFQVSEGHVQGVPAGENIFVPETPRWDLPRIGLCSLALLAAAGVLALQRRGTPRHPPLSTATNAETWMPDVGDQLACYRIVRHIGRGGMAAVFEVADQRGRPFAMKVPQPRTRSDEELGSRFQREMQIGRRLRHPNIVRLEDFAMQSATEPAWMVMELVDGPSLAQVLDTRHLLSPREAVDIISAVLLALDYGHAQGVIHRDIKPANILLTRSGMVKLADFGIARHANAETLTGTHYEMGTRVYMAPEQIDARSVDPRADLYATAVVLFEALCGQTPFSDCPASTIMSMKLGSEAPRISTVKADLLAFDGLLSRAMARRPEQRYPDARSFSAALQGVTL